MMHRAFYFLLTCILAGCNSDNENSNSWNLKEQVTFKHPSVQECFNYWVDAEGWQTIEDVTKLICSHGGIDTFEGIEQLTALQKFSFSYTAVNDVNLSNNRMLTRVIISHNPYLKSIDLSNNLELETVEVFYNSLEKIDLSNLPKLNYVNLQTNLLKSIVLEGTSVRMLYASGNLIEDIDLSTAIDIIDLDLRGNPLGKLDLSTLQLVETLLLDDASLTGLEIANNHRLRVLSLDNNHISTMRFYNNPDLRSVLLTHNPLDSATIDYLESIDWIDILRW